MVRTIEDTNLAAIAQAIRAKTGTEDTYKPSEMAAAIESIETGGGGGDEVASYLISNRAGLTSIAFPEGITRIASYAFFGCYNLVLTELPATITAIGNNAFAGCDGLAITELPEGIAEVAMSSFSSCKGLTTMTMPASLQYVLSSAFSLCTGLTEVTFKGTPEEIAENAFSGCSNLTTINVPWAEGAVAGAPWGATSATINYNSAPPITFYIDGVAYQTKPNINFNLWCASEYNVNNRFYTYVDENSSKRVADSGQEGAPDLYYNGTKIYANGVIVEGRQYTTGN
jgi:hypothetical protein